MVHRSVSGSSRGASTTEYTILLVGLAVVCIGIVTSYGQSVHDLWAGENNLVGGFDTLSDGLGDGEGSEGGEGPECPYSFNDSTGRWHNADNEMVSFEDASNSGC